jgi:hypothetical protein
MGDIVLRHPMAIHPRLLNIVKASHPAWYNHWDMDLQARKWKDMATDDKTKFPQEVHKYLLNGAHGEPKTKIYCTCKSQQGYENRQI